MSFIPDNEILAHGGTPVTTAVLDQSNYSIRYKECCTCLKILPYGKFRKDSSYKEGVRDRCLDCEFSPRLSTAEHAARLSEINYNSVRGQRWKHQFDYMNDAARFINPLHHSEFLYRLKRALPNSLYFMDGRIAGDISVYRVFGRPQEDGSTYRYLWYIPSGYMPSYSLYEFDARDVPIRERIRGWRTPLLRLLKSRMLTEDRCRKYFGEASGPASVVWRRHLYVLRNGHE